MTVWDIAKWPVLLVVVVCMIALLYYASPEREAAAASSRSLPGRRPGDRGVAAWRRPAFAFYVANFGSYNKTYGALGGVIVFLVWLWITNVAILLGAELNAERERAAPARRRHARGGARAPARRALRAEGQEAGADRVIAATTHHERLPMEIPKDKILDLVREHGKSDQLDQADQELPDQVDPERDAGLLEKFGLHPQDVLSKFGGGLPGF